MYRILAAVGFSLAAFVSPAAASPINSPVPTTNYISYMGNDWAWASPCSPLDYSCDRLDLTYQGTLGWRLPTAQEVTAYIASDIPAFVAAFFPGGTQACAAGWFSMTYKHCDTGDALSGVIYGLDNGWSDYFDETFVIRQAATAPTPAPVPVPGAAVLLLGALGGLAGLRRTRRRN